VDGKKFEPRKLSGLGELSRHARRNLLLERRSLAPWSKRWPAAGADDQTYSTGRGPRSIIPRDEAGLVDVDFFRYDFKNSFLPGGPPARSGIQPGGVAVNHDFNPDATNPESFRGSSEH
jgi:hypothetical protein